MRSIPKTLGSTGLVSDCVPSGVMAKLILHIGMPKTGSSAIQLSLSAASGNTSFIYPKLGDAPSKTNHTDSLVQLFSSKRGKIAARRNYFGKTTRGSGADDAKIRLAAGEAGNRPVILSSEGAYSYLAYEDLLTLKSFAEEMFDSITIAAYVREPFSLVSSNFHNKIKSSRLSKFNPKFPHYKNFEKFDRVFGIENVHLWEYDRRKFPNGSVVEDFCSRLGLKAAESEQVNVRLSRPAVSAVYRLNRTFGKSDDNWPAFAVARSAVISEFPHEEWPRFRLSPSIVQSLIESNRKDMDWIKQRMGWPSIVAPEQLNTDVASKEDLLHIAPEALDTLQRIGSTLPFQSSGLLREALTA